MKATVTENKNCYGIEFTAEDLQDAAVLVRMGMDATKELRSHGSSVLQNGTFLAYIVIGKRKQAGSDVVRRHP